MIQIGLGGGCHWCTEGVFQSLVGIEEVKQGWIASVDDNSSFSESVLVTFDPAVVLCRSKETEDSFPQPFPFVAASLLHFYTLTALINVEPDAVLSHVSCCEVNAFANWKGMRLPTEFGWEAALDNLNWGSRWEWTASAYLPYLGFKTKKGAVGEYNGKFMINQMVLRWASTATAKGHSRKTYRNFFHLHFQWQFSGIRLAR